MFPQLYLFVTIYIHIRVVQRCMRRVAFLVAQRTRDCASSVHYRCTNTQAGSKEFWASPFPFHLNSKYFTLYLKKKQRTLGWTLYIHGGNTIIIFIETIILLVLR